ncbi:hypothetical protein FA13DRAFT_1736859 [Coprinellus micaceus]|uniref:Uncharacterized protein n=1 Tax=Coprinellus micaceus TaxID=71717 RepID=A0A4Y7SYZ0_COPMI|nr:hypothetical protein FA13DRAFT_1736859 [Coprinellus micaceus]
MESHPAPPPRKRAVYAFILQSSPFLLLCFYAKPYLPNIDRNSKRKGVMGDVASHSLALQGAYA